MTPPRRVSTVEDTLKALEAEAYDAAEDGPAGIFSKDRPSLFAPVYRADVLREWPLHTDFRPDNLPVRD